MKQYKPAICRYCEYKLQLLLYHCKLQSVINIAYRKYWEGKKKMKRRALGLILALSMTAGTLAGCGASSDGAAAAASESTAAASVEETEAVSEEKAPEETADSSAVSEEEEPAYADLISDISYIDDGNQLHMLDIYGSNGKTEPTKTVIEVHGGGFIGGNKTTNTDHSIVFADAGYVVVTPDYSKVPKDANFPEVIGELFTIYSWVQEHAEEYHIDTNNIFLSGDSAGGYYVLISMAILHDAALQEYFQVTPPEYSFSGFVTTCPDTDILAKREYLGEDKSGPEAFNANTIGADILLDDDLMGHMDLYSCTDPSSFEGLYMMTTPTDVTTGASVVKFDSYLSDNNVEHILNTYEGTENELGHVFNISHTDWAESIQANQDEIDFMESLLK